MIEGNLKNVEWISACILSSYVH